MLFQDYFIYNIISLFILTYLFLVGESCYHRWTILAFCVLSKSEEINPRKKTKGEEGSMCWLAATRHYCTHCNKNGGMEERVFDSFVLSTSQLPCLLVQSSKSTYFFHGPAHFLKHQNPFTSQDYFFIFFI